MQYIHDTEYASKGLIDLITDEEKQLENLQKRREGLLCEEKDFRRSSTVSPFEDDMHPAQEQAMAIAWNKSYQKRQEVEKQISGIEESMSAKSDSIDALCAALLQIAKQGISISHRGLQNCPDGRSVGSEKLKDVIWQARNQSMHYEEGKLSKPICDCFAALENSFDDRFSLTIHANKNLAYEVINILGWKNYSRYVSDLDQLL